MVHRGAFVIHPVHLANLLAFARGSSEPQAAESWRRHRKG